MILDVPDMFVEVLRRLEGLTPRRTVDLLRWASSHPEEAAQIAREWWKMKKEGKKIFQRSLQVLSSPRAALKYAKKALEEQRKKRALLREIIAKARKGCCEISMPNGVRCRIEYSAEDGAYILNFDVKGENIRAACWPDGILQTLLALKKGRFIPKNILAIIYRKKCYSTDSPATKVLLKSIEKNVSPAVIATVDGI